jgi:hypothetical protein
VLAVAIVTAKDDCLLQTVFLDVLAELVELLVRHHGKDIGGGVHPVYVAPGHHATPLRCASS